MPTYTWSDVQTNTNIFKSVVDVDSFIKQKDFINLKALYEQKIAKHFGHKLIYSYTNQWAGLTTMAQEFANFDYKFDKIWTIIKQLEMDIHELDQHFLDNESILKSTPSLLPVRGWITSYYGPRKSPYSGRTKMHEGIDIGAKIGTHIVSPADGVVTYSGKKPGFGIYVQIDHGYGIETIFAHSKESNVKRGQKLLRGDIIAKVGNTGYSTGPHVHYEIRVNGTPVDPLFYILD